MALLAELREWLLTSDPALRWQVQRDLLGDDASVWERTRSLVATEGFGAEILTRQDPDGQWAGGAYFPADFDFAGPEAQQGAGQPYTATTWALNSLRDFGLPGSVLADTVRKLAANSRWDYNDAPYWEGEVDCCINGFTIANGAWLGADVAALAGWFLGHQLEDGGWNCLWEEGATRSSFDSTLNSLKGLLAWEAVTGGTPELTAARRRGQEYLLERRLLFRLTTGQIVKDRIVRNAYPFRWVYTALNALDHFREASLLDAVPPDPRLAEAIELVRSGRQPDGTWLQQDRYPGRSWVEADVAVGEPSKWITFFATRVLAWWDSSFG
jgi:hypothetical protein